MRARDYIRLGIATAGIFFGVFTITLEGKLSVFSAVLIILGLAVMVIILRK